MRKYTKSFQARQMGFLRNQFAQAEGLPFRDIFAAATVMQAMQAAGAVDNERVYTSSILFWIFLSQALSSDQSCRAAVALACSSGSGR